MQPSRQGLCDCLRQIKREEIFRPSKVGSCSTRSVTGKAGAIPAQRFMSSQRWQDSDGGTNGSEGAVVCAWLSIRLAQTPLSVLQPRPDGFVLSMSAWKQEATLAPEPTAASWEP